MDKKKLLKDAEQFIIHNDECANIIIDGAIKQGAELLADFAEEIVNNLDKADVSNSLPVDFLQNEMIKAIKELGKESTAPDKDTPDWLESDIKRGMKWMYTRLTGNDC